MGNSVIVKLLSYCLISGMLLAMPMISIAQHRRTSSPEQYRELIKLRAALTADLGNLAAHEAFLNQWGDNKTLLAQYRIWMKRYPKNAIIPFAIGRDLANTESPEAQEFLLRAVQIDPNLAEAWSLLGRDANMRGNLELMNEYTLKAMKADGTNPQYVFDYAWSFKKLDTAAYHSLTLKLVKKFPQSDVSAKALYWLAADEQDAKKKITYYELFKKEFENSKSSWFVDAMVEYYRFMVFRDPQKALDIARIDRVPLHKKLADTLIKVNELLSQQKNAEANAFIQPVILSKTVGLDEPFLLFKARVANAAGDAKAAYDTIARYYSERPGDSLQKAMFTHAAKTGIGRELVQTDITRRRDLTARPADDFSLENYLTGANVSLADYRGKVILLTYWFPGCGPCRREMPFFENVLKNFDRNSVVYLGLNLQQDQDALVLPFLKSTGFSFIPLRDSWERKAGNLHPSGAPSNFIIDQDGRIVFSNFRIDADNEDQLRLMISDLLDSYNKPGKLKDTIAAK